MIHGKQLNQVSWKFIAKLNKWKKKSGFTKKLIHRKEGLFYDVRKLICERNFYSVENVGNCVFLQ